MDSPLRSPILSLVATPRGNFLHCDYDVNEEERTMNRGFTKGENLISGDETSIPCGTRGLNLNELATDTPTSHGSVTGSVGCPSISPNVLSMTSLKSRSQTSSSRVDMSFAPTCPADSLYGMPGYVPSWISSSLRDCSSHCTQHLTFCYDITQASRSSQRERPDRHVRWPTDCNIYEILTGFVKQLNASPSPLYLWEVLQERQLVRHAWQLWLRATEPRDALSAAEFLVAIVKYFDLRVPCSFYADDSKSDGYVEVVRDGIRRFVWIGGETVATRDGPFLRFLPGAVEHGRGDWWPWLLDILHLVTELTETGSATFTAHVLFSTDGGKCSLFSELLCYFQVGLPRTPCSEIQVFTAASCPPDSLLDCGSSGYTSPRRRRPPLHSVMRRQRRHEEALLGTLLRVMVGIVCRSSSQNCPTVCASPFPVQLVCLIVIQSMMPSSSVRKSEACIDVLIEAICCAMRALHNEALLRGRYTCSGYIHHLPSGTMSEYIISKESNSSKVQRSSNSWWHPLQDCFLPHLIELSCVLISSMLVELCREGEGSLSVPDLTTAGRQLRKSLLNSSLSACLTDLLCCPRVLPELVLQYSAELLCTMLRFSVQDAIDDLGKHTSRAAHRCKCLWQTKDLFLALKTCLERGVRAAHVLFVNNDDGSGGGAPFTLSSSLHHSILPPLQMEGASEDLHDASVGVPDTIGFGAAGGVADEVWAAEARCQCHIKVASCVIGCLATVMTACTTEVMLSLRLFQEGEIDEPCLWCPTFIANRSVVGRRRSHRLLPFLPFIVHKLATGGVLSVMVHYLRAFTGPLSLMGEQYARCRFHEQQREICDSVPQTKWKLPLLVEAVATEQRLLCFFSTLLTHFSVRPVMRIPYGPDFVLDTWMRYTVHVATPYLRECLTDAGVLAFENALRCIVVLCAEELFDDPQSYNNPVVVDCTSLPRPTSHTTCWRLMNKHALLSTLGRVVSKPVLHCHQVPILALQIIELFLCSPRLNTLARRDLLVSTRYLLPSLAGVVTGRDWSVLTTVPALRSSTSTLARSALMDGLRMQRTLQVCAIRLLRRVVVLSSVGFVGKDASGVPTADKDADGLPLTSEDLLAPILSASGLISFIISTINVVDSKDDDTREDGDKERVCHDDALAMEYSLSSVHSFQTIAPTVMTDPSSVACTCRATSRGRAVCITHVSTGTGCPCHLSHTALTVSSPGEGVRHADAATAYSPRRRSQTVGIAVLCRATTQFFTECRDGVDEVPSVRHDGAEGYDHPQAPFRNLCSELANNYTVEGAATGGVQGVSLAISATGTSEHQSQSNESVSGYVNAGGVPASYAFSNGPHTVLGLSLDNCTTTIPPITTVSSPLTLCPEALHCADDSDDSINHVTSLSLEFPDSTHSSETTSSKRRRFSSKILLEVLLLLHSITFSPHYPQSRLHGVMWDDVYTSLLHLLRHLLVEKLPLGAGHVAQGNCDAPSIPLFSSCQYSFSTAPYTDELLLAVLETLARMMGYCSAATGDVGTASPFSTVRDALTVRCADVGCSSTDDQARSSVELDEAIPISASMRAIGPGGILSANMFAPPVSYTPVTTYYSSLASSVENEDVVSVSSASMNAMDFPGRVQVLRNAMHTNDEEELDPLTRPDAEVMEAHLSELLQNVVGLNRLDQLLCVLYGDHLKNGVGQPMPVMWHPSIYESTSCSLANAGGSQPDVSCALAMQSAAHVDFPAAEVFFSTSPERAFYAVRCVEFLIRRMKRGSYHLPPTRV